MAVYTEVSDDELEELSHARSAAAITAWLTGRLGGPPAQAEPQAEAARPGEPPSAESAWMTTTPSCSTS